MTLWSQCQGPMVGSTDFFRENRTVDSGINDHIAVAGKFESMIFLSKMVIFHGYFEDEDVPC